MVQQQGYKGTALNLQTVTTEIRDLLSLFVTKVKSSTALGLTDLNHLSEGFLLELFREVYLLPGLRNLNREKKNFPGLDLGDDSTGRAFQVTATPDLVKVKETLGAVIQAKLHERFRSVQIFVVTEKQSSYSQTAIDQVTQGLLQFTAATDVVDYRDLLATCSTLELDHLKRILDVLKKHLVAPHDAATRSSSAPYFPQGQEPVELNVVPIWVPSQMYLADFIEPTKAKDPGNKKGRRGSGRVNPRDVVAKDILQRGFEVPEDFEVHSGQVVSFQDLSESIPALAPYFDQGTVTTLSPKEFYGIDQDHLHVFKSLLRRCLQRQLRRDRVRWQNELHLFFYGPFDDEEERAISWKGEKTAERVVYKRTMKNNKPEEILTCKHFAFYVGFHLIGEAWYLSITPTWFFSRDGYRIDRFGADRISWLKRKENDQQVHTHFRFILHRLNELQARSLFDGPKQEAQVQIGDPVRFSNHPFLPDQIWNPPSAKGASDEEAAGQSSIPL